jgi:hypothetical protein
VQSDASDLGNAAANFAGHAGASMLSQIAQPMASAADGLLKTLTTFWMNIDTPDLGTAGVVHADTSWIVALVAVASILVAAARMAIRRRGEPGTVMLLGLARLVVVSAAATVIVTAAGKLSDLFSQDLMDSAAAHLGSQGWTGKISTVTMAAAIGPGAGLLLIVSLLVIFASLIQLMLMILRVGLLVILTGTLPLAAAASMTDWGESWWRKHLGWLTAWLLYKPAAALLYVSAFQLTQNGKSPVEALSGFALLVLSVLILPALLRVIVPMTAAMGAASGGALTMGVAGAVASGAIRVAGIRRTPAPAPDQKSPAPGGDGGPSGAGDAAQSTPPPPGPSSNSPERRDDAPPDNSPPPGGNADPAQKGTDDDGSGGDPDPEHADRPDANGTPRDKPSRSGPPTPPAGGPREADSPPGGNAPPENGGPTGAGDSGDEPRSEDMDGPYGAAPTGAADPPDESHPEDGG